jgi:hypothetical protein
VNGHWNWIHLARAPENPTQLPHVLDLIEQATRTPNPGLLKKSFRQLLDQRAKERGVASGRELLTQTTLVKMEQTRTPEVEGCQAFWAGERGVAVLPSPGKQQAAEAWLQQAHQESFDELAALINMPLEIKGPGARPVDPEELLQDLGLGSEEAREAFLKEARGASPTPQPHACPDAECMDQHCQIMKANFCTPEVFVLMIDELRKGPESDIDPARYYWCAEFALREGVKYFINPTEVQAYTHLAHYIEGAVPLTAELFPAPVGMCWLSEATERLTPGEKIRAVSWVVTRTAYSGAGKPLILVPTEREQVPKYGASAVWVQLWHEASSFEEQFGLFPLPLTHLWHVFSGKDLTTAGVQAALELSWLAAFLAGLRAGTRDAA